MWYLAEESAAFITQESQDNFFDLSDDGGDDFPVGSGSDIESETEGEYTKSNTTDEDKLEQNVFGTGPIPKQKRGCWTRGGIRGGINVSHERHRTQLPQDKQLGTQPLLDEQPAAPRIAEEGESSRDKDGDTGGNEKDNHWWTTEVKAPPVYLFQANPGVLIETPENLRPTFCFLKFFSAMRWLSFLLLKQVVMLRKFVKTWLLREVHNSENGSQQMPQKWECL